MHGALRSSALPPTGTSDHRSRCSSSMSQRTRDPAQRRRHLAHAHHHRRRRRRGLCSSCGSSSTTGSAACCRCHCSSLRRLSGCLCCILHRYVDRLGACLQGAPHVATAVGHLRVQCGSSQSISQSVHPLGTFLLTHNHKYTHRPSSAPPAVLPPRPTTTPAHTAPLWRTAPPPCRPAPARAATRGAGAAPDGGGWQGAAVGQILCTHVHTDTPSHHHCSPLTQPHPHTHTHPHAQPHTTHPPTCENCWRW